MRAREPDSSGYVESDGVRLAWESFNDTATTTVLFVPIDTCVHSRAWKGQVAYLAQHVRVVTVDPPGNGRSGRALDPQAYGDLAMVADHLAVMDHLGVDRAVLAGICVSAWQALLTAALHPERVLGLYGPQIVASHSHAIGDPAELLAALGEVHPTAFFGVPRVWEKIKTGISAKLAADPNPDNVTMVQDSMAAGLAWVQAQEVGGTMTPEIEEAYRKADEAILGFLKLLLGLDQVTWAASAAAPMPLEVAKFMGGLGLQVYDVYGMTETTGAFTSNGPGAFKLGTVGRPNPGIEVRLAEDGEMAVLVIEQNIGVACAVSENVAIMVNGRINRVIEAPRLAADRALQQRLLGVGRHGHDDTPVAEAVAPEGTAAPARPALPSPWLPLPRRVRRVRPRRRRRTGAGGSGRDGRGAHRGARRARRRRVHRRCRSARPDPWRVPWRRRRRTYAAVPA